MFRPAVPFDSIFSSVDVERLEFLSEYPQLARLHHFSGGLDNSEEQSFSSSASLPLDSVDPALRALIHDALVQDKEIYQGTSKSTPVAVTNNSNLPLPSASHILSSVSPLDKFRRILNDTRSQKMKSAKAYIHKEKKKIDKAQGRRKELDAQQEIFSFDSCNVQTVSTQKADQMGTGSAAKQSVEISICADSRLLAIAQQDLKNQLGKTMSEMEHEANNLGVMEERLKYQIELKSSILKRSQQTEILERKTRELENRVEELFDIRQRRSLRQCFLRWINHINELKNLERKFQRHVAYKSVCSYWSQWKRESQRRMGEREERIHKRQMQLEQEKLTRALRFHRQYSLSRALIQWTVWIASRREQEAMRREHAARKMKIMKYLDKARKAPESTEQDYPTPNNPGHRDAAQEYLAEISIVRNNITKSPSERPPKVRKSIQSNVVRSKTDDMLLKGMQQREYERQERKRKMEMRLKKQEEERKRRQLEDEERLREDERMIKEEALRGKKQAILEAKKIEKEKARKRQLQTEKIAKARQHHAILVMKYFGLIPLQKHLMLKNLLERKAIVSRNLTLVKRSFKFWLSKMELAQGERERAACRAYNQKLMLDMMSKWRQRNNFLHLIQYQSSKHHHSKILAKFVIIWRFKQHLRQSERLQNQRRLERVADDFAKRYVPRRYLRLWRTCVIESKKERWRDYRKSIMKNKVRSWLGNSKFGDLGAGLLCQSSKDSENEHEPEVT